MTSSDYLMMLILLLHVVTKITRPAISIRLILLQGVIQVDGTSSSIFWFGFLKLSHKKFILKHKQQVGFDFAFRINQTAIFILFQPKVQESVLFYVFLLRLIPQESCIFPSMSAVCFLFLPLARRSYKIGQMKLQNVSNGGDFSFYKRF